MRTVLAPSFLCVWSQITWKNQQVSIFLRYSARTPMIRQIVGILELWIDFFFLRIFSTSGGYD